jgi:hypothetical protein
LEVARADTDRTAEKERALRSVMIHPYDNKTQTKYGVGSNRGRDFTSGELGGGGEGVPEIHTESRPS